MSKLLISLAVSIALFLLLILPHVDAGVKGTLTSAGGHKCTEWVERRTSASKNPNADIDLQSERRLKLTCHCKDKEGNPIKYSCVYVSRFSKCCQTVAQGDKHYHGHEPAYYGQAADQLKGI